MAENTQERAFVVMGREAELYNSTLDKLAKVGNAQAKAGRGADKDVALGIAAIWKATRNKVQSFDSWKAQVRADLKQRSDVAATTLQPRISRVLRVLSSDMPEVKAVAEKWMNGEYDPSEHVQKMANKARGNTTSGTGQNSKAIREKAITQVVALIVAGEYSIKELQEAVRKAKEVAAATEQAKEAKVA